MATGRGTRPVCSAPTSRPRRNRSPSGRRATPSRSTSTASLVLRPASAEGIRGAAARAGEDSLYRVVWSPAPTPENAGGESCVVLGEPAWLAPLGLPSYPDPAAVPEVPELVLVAFGAPDGDLAEGTHAAVHEALALVRTWLADD